MFETVTILRNYVRAKYRRRFTTRVALERWQQNRLQVFRKRVLACLPHYADRAYQPWENFPVTDKAWVAEHFEGLNRLNLSYEEALRKARAADADGQSAEVRGVTIGMSSGTSGKRSIYLVSKHERLQWLGVMMAKVLSQPVWTKQRVALLLAANSQLYTTANQNRRLDYRFFDLREPLESHRVSLNIMQPTILFAPAQVLRVLAGWQQAGKLQIAPRKVISGSEVLTPETERVIGEVWGSPVHQIYQCTEGFLGITCPLGTIHLNEEFVLFEKQWVDRERRTFNPIITDFTRRSQAMIRYRMNDLLVERSEPCPCGSVCLGIQRIEGRCDDLLVLSRTNSPGYTYLFPDDLRATVLDAVPSATDFRIVQTSLDTIQFSLDGPVDHADHNAVVRELGRALVRKGAQTANIEPIPFELDWTAAKKLRRVRRLFPMPEP